MPNPPGGHFFLTVCRQTNDTAGVASGDTAGKAAAASVRVDSLPLTRGVSLLPASSLAGHSISPGPSGSGPIHCDSNQNLLTDAELVKVGGRLMLVGTSANTSQEGD
jgi:hypothetical protein